MTSIKKNNIYPFINKGLFVPFNHENATNDESRKNKPEFDFKELLTRKDTDNIFTNVFPTIPSVFFFENDECGDKIINAYYTLKNYFKKLYELKSVIMTILEQSRDEMDKPKTLFDKVKYNLSEENTIIKFNPKLKDTISNQSYFIHFCNDFTNSKNNIFKDNQHNDPKFVGIFQREYKGVNKNFFLDLFREYSNIRNKILNYGIYTTKKKYMVGGAGLSEGNIVKYINNGKIYYGKVDPLPYLTSTRIIKNIKNNKRLSSKQIYSSEAKNIPTSKLININRDNNEIIKVIDILSNKIIDLQLSYYTKYTEPENEELKTILLNINENKKLQEKYEKIYMNLVKNELINFVDETETSIIELSNNIDSTIKKYTEKWIQKNISNFKTFFNYIYYFKKVNDYKSIDKNIKTLCNSLYSIYMFVGLKDLDKPFSLVNFKNILDKLIENSINLNITKYELHLKKLSDTIDSIKKNTKIREKEIKYKLINKKIKKISELLEFCKDTSDQYDNFSNEIFKYFHNSQNFYKSYNELKNLWEEHKNLNDELDTLETNIFKITNNKKIKEQQINISKKQIEIENKKQEIDESIKYLLDNEENFKDNLINPVIQAITDSLDFEESEIYQESKNLSTKKDGNNVIIEINNQYQIHKINSSLSENNIKKSIKLPMTFEKFNGNRYVFINKLNKKGKILYENKKNDEYLIVDNKGNIIVPNATINPYGINHFLFDSSSFREISEEEYNLIFEEFNENKNEKNNYTSLLAFNYIFDLEAVIRMKDMKNKNMEELSKNNKNINYNKYLLNTNENNENNIFSKTPQIFKPVLHPIIQEYNLLYIDEIDRNIYKKKHLENINKIYDNIYKNYSDIINDSNTNLYENIISLIDLDYNCLEFLYYYADDNLFNNAVDLNHSAKNYINDQINNFEDYYDEYLEWYKKFKDYDNRGSDNDVDKMLYDEIDFKSYLIKLMERIYSS